MGTFSIFHWLIFLIYVAVFVIPIAKVLRRLGFSPWLALLAIVPLVNVIMLWIFAYGRWPRDTEQAKTF